MEIRKVPASAGAQWLLDAFRLVQKSPTGYGLLVLTYAALALAVGFAVTALPDIAYVVQALFFVIGPLLVAGMIYAAHEVDEGRGATPMHLLASLRSGKAGRVLTTLIPQVVVAVAVLLLLYAILGKEDIEAFAALMTKLEAQAQTGGQVDPQLLAEMPIGRLLLWLMLALALVLISIPLTFTVLPDILFGDVSLWPAMKRSFAACLRNLPAFLTCLAMGFVVLMAVSIGFGILMGVLQFLLGPTAMMIGNVLLQSVFVCLFAGTMYFAWKQMLGGGNDAATTTGAGVAM